MVEASSNDRRLQSPQSVTRVIRIIEALCASPRPMSLADEDFVVGVETAWRLGPGAFGLGSALLAARRRVQSSDIVRDGIRHLAQRSGETVLFGVRDEDGETLTYVDVIESRNTVRFIVTVGDRRPLYCTAGGRALLAAGEDAELARYLERLRPGALTTRTQTGKPRLAAAILTARSAGFAQTIDQASDGVTGTAAPVRDAAGTVIGALIVAAPSLRLQHRLAELARLVVEEAAAISRSLGFWAAG